MSVGTDGRLPRLPTQVVRGKLTIDAALTRLLRGSGYLARRVGPTAWRIEPAASVVVTPPLAQAPPAAPSVPPAQIVVSATKRDLTLENTPIAATIVPIAGAERYDPAADTQRVAERVEGLSLTGQGPGRNRMFLRGVADSPFGGKSQATVAVLLDDSRLTYVASDPDIRLVDVERIELLKGPQGSLYGSGALGGIYRIVTRRADPSGFSIGGSVGGQSVAAGEFGGTGSLVINLPLVTDVAALRLVAYAEKSPGWLDTGIRKDSNETTVAGLRTALGIELGGGWRADAIGLGQWLQANDSSYTYLPEAHQRPAQLPEPHDNDLVHGSLRLAHNGAVDAVFSAGYTLHDVNDRFDTTQGAESFGLADPQTLDDKARYRLWDSEARMSGNWGRIGWLGGLSLVESRQNSTRVLAGTGGVMTVEAVARRASETALFGEATLPLTDTLDATLGGRLFHTTLNEKRSTSGDKDKEELRRAGVTPSASLAWHPREGELLYFRYGSARRQGGSTVAANGDVKPLDEDELTTIEGGWRRSIGAIEFDLSMYRSWWRDIQSDVLLADGLVETANVGDGSITGAELSLKTRLDGGWKIDAGATFQSALLTRDTSGLELHDRRLPVVPSWTLRSLVARTIPLGSWDATLSAYARYVGPARLSFDPALDRPMGNYLDTGLGVAARRQHWTFTLEGRNLLNARGDSFAFGNPLRVYSTPEYIRQDPFSVRLSVTFGP